MMVPAIAVAAIEDWLRKQFSQAPIQIDQDFTREVVLYRVHRVSAPALELEISYETFDDLAPPEIVRLLESEKAVERFLENATMRLQLFHDGTIPYFETWHLRCDGRRYRIVRTARGDVRIFDAEDAVLAHSPPGMVVMDDSIFRRPESEWFKDIRAWRGPNQ